MVTSQAAQERFLPKPSVCNLSLQVDEQTPRSKFTTDRTFFIIAVTHQEILLEKIITMA